MKKVKYLSSASYSCIKTLLCDLVGFIFWWALSHDPIFFLPQEFVENPLYGKEAQAVIERIGSDSKPEVSIKVAITFITNLRRLVSFERVVTHWTLTKIAFKSRSDSLICFIVWWSFICLFKSLNFFYFLHFLGGFWDPSIWLWRTSCFEHAGIHKDRCQNSIQALEAESK